MMRTSTIAVPRTGDNTAPTRPVAAEKMPNTPTTKKQTPVPRPQNRRRFDSILSTTTLAAASPASAMRGTPVGGGGGGEDPWVTPVMQFMHTAESSFATHILSLPHALQR